MGWETLALGMMIVVLIAGVGFFAVAMDPVTPNCAGNAPTNLQCGTATITIPQFQVTASTTITFPKAFLSNPNVTLVLTSAPGTQAQNLGTSYFLARPPTTWTSMPAAVTEFLGLTDDRIYYNFRSPGMTTLLSVTCTVGSSGASPTLQVQYTTDLSGATGWANLSSTAAVDNLFACPGVSLSTVTAVPNAIISTDVLLRIVGAGGAGVGDNPVFTVIGLYTSFPAILPINLRASAVTTTSFLLSVYTTLKVASAAGYVITVNWEAIA